MVVCLEHGACPHCMATDQTLHSVNFTSGSAKKAGICALQWRTSCHCLHLWLETVPHHMCGTEPSSYSAVLLTRRQHYCNQSVNSGKRVHHGCNGSSTSFLCSCVSWPIQEVNGTRWQVILGSGQEQRRKITEVSWMQREGKLVILASWQQQQQHIVFSQAGMGEELRREVV